MYEFYFESMETLCAYGAPHSAIAKIMQTEEKGISYYCRKNVFSICPIQIMFSAPRMIKFAKLPQDLLDLHFKDCTELDERAKTISRLFWNYCKKVEAWELIRNHLHKIIDNLNSNELNLCPIELTRIGIIADTIPLPAKINN